MLSFSRKTDYALVALAGLVEHDATGETPISARELAERYGLPQPVLMNILKGLHRAGLLDSRRGVNGGYTLADSPDRITLADVVEAVDGPVKVALCCDKGQPEHDGCDLATSCPITGSIQRLNHRLTRIIGRVTLGELIASDVDVPAFDLGLSQVRAMKG